MPKIKDLHWALNQIAEDLRNADDEVDSLIKIHHPNRYNNEEYKERISKK